MSTKPKHVLLVRLDRIGDLALTMSVDAAFDRSRILWWVSEGLGFIAEAAVPPRAHREIPKSTGLRLGLQLLRELRAGRPDIAVVFHAPWWVGFLLCLARVPVRIGPRSQWHSFLFFNRGVRQRRSRSTAHEHEYNVRLLESGLGLADGSLPRTPLALRPTLSRELEGALLERHGLRSGTYAVVHPGMAGSALNWPTEKWAELIRRLAERKPVVLTGTPADEACLAPLRPLLAENSAVHWLDGRLSPAELLSVLAHARSCTAPSTGVAHLAAALGTRTVGLYSPVPVQAARRWSPLGPDVQALSPAVACPAWFACQGEACPHFNCMDLIRSDAAFEATVEGRPRP